MNDSLSHLDHPTASDVPPVTDPYPLAHLAQAVRRDLGAVLRVLLGVVLAYGTMALAYHLFSPSEKMTRLPFRLEFKGVDTGNYPNGTKFSTSDIIATPILLEVYRNNKLDRFCPFSKFANRIFLHESNMMLQALETEYAAKLGDRTLNAVDRERTEREYELKRAGIAKSQYALSYSRSDSTMQIPQELVDKSLNDILQAWAASATRAGALRLPVLMLSSQTLSAKNTEGRPPVVAICQLRATTREVLFNIERLKGMQGAYTVRLQDGTSLADIQFRLETLMRFELEPLTSAIVSAHRNPQTVATLSSFRAYHERQLRAAESRVDAIHDTLASYQQPGREARETTTPAKDGEPATDEGRRAGNVVPQLSDSFIDRIVTLTDRSADREFRQRLANELKDVSVSTIPYQEEIEYYTALIEHARGGITSELTTEVDVERLRGELRDAVTKVNAVYTVLSRNLTPSTQLFAISGPTATSTKRSTSLVRLFLMGLILVFLILLVSFFVILVRERVRREEQMEERAS